MANSSIVLQPAYIVDRRQDYIWFVSLPFAAVCFALVSGHYLPGAALAAIALWVTIPHHFVTWLRVYGSPAEFARFKERFILGPIVLVAFAYGLIQWAPLSLVLIVTLWDHQHSLMQQYGFARVYDFKAKAGTPADRQVRLGLQLDLLWQYARGVATFFYGLGAHVARVASAHQRGGGKDGALRLVDHCHCLRPDLRGAYRLLRLARLRAQPLKYVFLLSSYFLWYFTSFTTAYLLVFAVAHRIMHGIQYIVMVYFYNRHKVERTGGDSTLMRYVAGKGGVKFFLLLCAAYAVVFHALSEGLVRDFGFGLSSASTPILTSSAIRCSVPLP